MAMFLELAWLIPVLPVVAFLVIAFLGRRLWEGGAAVALVLVGAAAVLAAGVVLDVQHLDHPFEMRQQWLLVDLQSGPVAFDVGVYVDNLTALMLIVVTSVSFLVILYSTAYMHGDAGVRRYYAEITLFVGVMLGLVLANNFLLMFIMWELVGLCSYLLIGFWYRKPSAASAAKKAFLVTRIGDIFFLAGILILAALFHSLNYTDLFSAHLAPEQSGLLTLALLCIFGGAVGKSAQFPLHVWLPDAMEGPTTVSALIHAATMVKAGVYLVARSYPLLVQSPDALLVVAVVGGFTALFAATMALTAYDVKRVLAYSTISQLAYMFLALGIGAAGVAAWHGYTAGTFHLGSHAFSKALLFLAAGSVIHAVGTNDMRYMGGLRRIMPITSLAMLVGALSLAGIPPFSAFWSKDEILAEAFSAWTHGGGSVFLLLYVMGLATAFLTAFYMFRLWFMTFGGEYRGGGTVDPEALAAAHAPQERAPSTAPQTGSHHASAEVEPSAHAHHATADAHAQAHDYGHPHESPRAMTVPLAILIGLATIWGLLFVVNAGGIQAFSHFEEVHEGSATAFEFVTGAEHAKSAGAVLAATFGNPLTYVSVAVGLAGIFLAYLYYGRPEPLESPEPFPKAAAVKLGGGASFHRLLTERYYMDHLFLAVADRFVIGTARLFDWLDRNVVDATVNGVAGVSMRASASWRRVQTGNVQDYASVFVAGLVILVLVLLYVFPAFPALVGGA